MARKAREVSDSGYRMVCRRSQRGHISWSKAQRIWDFFVEKPRIKVQIWH